VSSVEELSRSEAPHTVAPVSVAGGLPGKDGRTTLSGRLAYALVAGVIGLGLFASVTPSPLYQVYAAIWHFSPLMLTLIYATYALGVLTTLLLAGGVSDQVGRRPVLLVALGALMISTVVYMAADSVVWLFVARGLQGLATGAALSTASAAMLDLHPSRDAAGVGITNGVVSAGGLGLGMLVSSSLVQLGWESRVLPYVVLFGLLVIALVGAFVMPEPVIERRHLTLTPQRPSVPAVVRRPFVLAGLAVLASWSIGGLFFSLGPALSAHLFHSTNVIVSGIGVVALAGSATLAGLLFGRIPPWIGASVGSVALAAGMLLIVAAAATGRARSTSSGPCSAASALGSPSSGACGGWLPLSRTNTAVRSCRPSISSPMRHSRSPPSSLASWSRIWDCPRPSRSSAASSPASPWSSPSRLCGRGQGPDARQRPVPPCRD
jgi:MFS family permease